MIVVAIIGLLTTLAIPNLAKARDTSRLNMIYSNLRTLDAAKDQWAMDNNQATGTPMPDITVLSNYFRYGSILNVIHETYVPNAVGLVDHVEDASVTEIIAKHGDVGHRRTGGLIVVHRPLVLGCVKRPQIAIDHVEP